MATRPAVKAIGKLPERIRLGHRQWQLAFADDLQDDNGQALDGWCRPDIGIILMDSRLTPDREIEVILHEVLHAGIAGDTGIKTPAQAESEEFHITRAAQTISALLVQNPKFVKYLLSFL